MKMDPYLETLSQLERDIRFCDFLTRKNLPKSYEVVRLCLEMADKAIKAAWLIADCEISEKETLNRKSFKNGKRKFKK